jgi:NAD(P)-dependent dehydrogenase (short-subunit alcohol dehydrogenase family)
MILEGKTVLVSGVGAGLGREVARLALRDGARVVLAARTESVLAQTAEELDPSGKRIAYRRADITKPEDCEALAAVAVERFGAVDAMVQVAAYENVFGGLYDGDFEKWRRAFDTNVLGSLTLIRAVAPQMKKAGGGSLVLIGSLSMYLPQLPQAGYAASKGALLSAMYYLAKELGPDKIRVNMVVPSWMWGPPVEAFVQRRAKAEKVDPEAIADEIRSRIPLGEIVPDEDVAEAVVFLASDRARSITGQSLIVNGGETMR